MLLAMTAFQPFSEMSLSSAGNWPPALLTSPSMRPPQASTRSTASLTWSSRRRSAAKVKVSGSSSSCFTCSSFSGVRPISASRAPSDLSSWAVQRPSPEPPPVTMMVWPANRPGRKIGMVLHGCCCHPGAQAKDLCPWQTAMRSFAGARDDRSLLDPDVGGFHDLRPLRHLGAQEGREFFRGRADGVGAQVGELGLDVVPCA